MDPRDPLLTTKLYLPPPRPGVVARPRLLAQIRAALERPLTVIVAPPGSGKTTLLSLWHTTPPGSGWPVAWVSLDAGDNDPVRFWTYVLAALEAIHPEAVGGARSLLHAPQPPPLAGIVAVLINALAGIRAPFALILDDYHLIETAAIHESIGFLLDRRPPALRLVLTSRSGPPLPLARMRARGELAEVRIADLRCTLDEATAFLRDGMGLDLAPAAIRTLEERTEGWIAGLQLAALALQGSGDPAGFITAFAGSHRYIVDYLAEEVLSRQPEPVQTFLLQTAILDRLSDALCDAVTGRSAGQAMLEKLEGANLFLVPLDDRRQWYRYHHLFADFLRHRLLRTAPDIVPVLHQRAASWYEQHGLLPEAVGHAIAAADWPQAAALIERAGEPLLMRGATNTVQNWLAALPEEQVLARPRLCVFRACAVLLTGQMDLLEPWLTAAREADTASVRAEGAVLQALIVALQGDLLQSAALVNEALEHLPADNFLRSLVVLDLGFPYMFSGDVEAAIEAFAEAARVGQATGNHLVALMARAQVAEQQLVGGRLHEAARTYRQAEDLARLPDGQPLPIVGLLHLSMAELLREWNDLPGALRYLDEGLAMGKQLGEMGVFDGYITLGRVRQALGDPDGASAALEHAAALARQMGVRGALTLVEAHAARLAVAQGRVADAGRWAAVVARQRTEPALYLDEPVNLSLARVHIAQGASDAALALLQSMLPEAEQHRRQHSVIENLMLQALAYRVAGQGDAALGALGRALTLAEPEGFVRLFADEGGPLAALLREFLLAAPASDSRAVSPAYVQHLLGVIGAGAPASSGGFTSLVADPAPAPRAPDLLHERELEVLCLLDAGLSNREIADRLVVALSTVKWHINNIYGKLDVRSRTQALARARELGLL